MSTEHQENGRPKEERVSENDKSWAQRAAEHDMAFGQMTLHMTDFYDNEHQAERRDK